MEAVARQFATDRKCLVLRNGWFSYRWTQILEMGSIPSEAVVLKARRIGSGSQAAFAPAPIDDVVAHISHTKPDVVFAPHVEITTMHGSVRGAVDLVDEGAAHVRNPMAFRAS